MHILPSEIPKLLESFRPLMRAEVFETFMLLLSGLIICEAKHVAVRRVRIPSSNRFAKRLSAAREFVVSPRGMFI